MARQIANFVSGKIGNVVFYKRGDVYIARSVPGKVRQTKNTKKRSANFGIASRTGKTLRPLLLPVLPFPKDKIMQGRFSGAISKWLKTYNTALVQPVDDVPFLNYFNFNLATSFEERCSLNMMVVHPSMDVGEVKLPAFAPVTAIAAPGHTYNVVLTIVGA